MLSQQSEIRLANNTAQEYENELNTLNHEFSQQKEELSKEKHWNAELQNDLRSKNDEIMHLKFSVSF